MKKIKRYKTLIAENEELLKEEMFKGDSYYDRKASDSVALDEIELFADNDANLYKQRLMPIIENIKRKIKSGKYDHSKAPKLFLYYVQDAMQRYAKEYSPGSKWSNLLSTKDRMILAQKYADFYYDEIMSGNYN